MTNAQRLVHSADSVEPYQGYRQRRPEQVSKTRIRRHWLQGHVTTGPTICVRGKAGHYEFIILSLLLSCIHQ